MIKYGFHKIVDLSFEDTIDAVTDALKNEGFGILTKIDVQEKFKEKLNVDFKKYIILGACNPRMAHQALLAEENIGLLLPCNVIVYEKENKTAVAIIKPSVAMQMVENNNLGEVAGVVENKLRKVFDAM